MAGARLPITKQDLAEVSGTTLHSVSRSVWETAGLVIVGRRKIKIVVRDVQGLSELAECGGDEEQSRSR
jgi:CRP/FNR family transcriptional regulator, nitrogen oxide reductase regulator